MIQPDVRRTVELKQSVTGGDIMDALRKIAENVEGKYVQRLMSDCDEVQTWDIGIVGRDPHEDIDIRTEHPSLGFLGVQSDKQYIILGVGSTHWQDYHSMPITYDPQKMIKAVVRVRDDLERLFNRG